MGNIEFAAENTALRAALAALEHRLAEQAIASREQTARLEGIVSELGAQAGVLEAIFNSLADGLVIADQTGKLTHLNAEGEQIVGGIDLGRQVGGWSHAYGFFLADKVTPYPEQDLPLARALGGAVVDRQEFFVRNRSKPEGVWLQSSASPIRLPDGSCRGAVSIFRDVSERKRREEEMTARLASEREKSEALRRLKEAVLSLSTPILELWDDVLAVPVIGVVDSQRSGELMERLLEQVEEKQCRFVILDITGVEFIDSAVADRLLKLVRAVGILGASCMLTGARTGVAQTLVSLGADLGSLETLRSLKHGLRACLRRMEDDDGGPVAQWRRPRGRP